MATVVCKPLYVVLLSHMNNVYDPLDELLLALYILCSLCRLERMMQRLIYCVGTNSTFVNGLSTRTMNQ